VAECTFRIGWLNTLKNSELIQKKIPTPFAG